MAEDNILKAVRVLAARAVDKKDGDYIFRYLCRWYSKEFHTPLAEAEDVPVEDLLQHYFEVQYEGLDEDELDEEVKRLIETDAERCDRERREAEDKAADEAFFQEELAKAKQALDQAKTTLDKIPAHDSHPIAGADTRGRALATTAADKGIREIPPDIKMTFVSESELDDLDAWDLLGPPKKG